MSEITRISLNLVADEELATWQTVRNHYHKAYSNSAVLLDLVEKKATQIDEGETRRQIAQVTLNTIESVRDNELSELLSKMARIEIELSAIKRAIALRLEVAVADGCDAVGDEL